MQVTRAEGRVEEWAELSIVASDEAAERLTADQLEHLEAEAARAFAPPVLLASMAEALASQDPARLEATVGFFSTPLGRRVLMDDRGALTGEALRGEPQFLSRVMLEGMAGPRWDAVRRLEASLGASRDVMALGSTIALSLARGAHAFACGEPSAWPRIEKHTRQRVEVLRPLVTPRVVATLEFSHADLTRSDLQRYAGFAEGEGAWLYAAIGHSLEAALESAARTLEARLAPVAAAGCD